MLLKSNLFENEKSAAAPQNLMGLLLLATRCYWFCCCPEQLCWSPEMMIRHNDEMIGSTPKSALTAKLGFQWWFLALHKSRFVLVYNNQTNQTSFSSTKAAKAELNPKPSSRLHFISAVLLHACGKQRIIGFITLEKKRFTFFLLLLKSNRIFSEMRSWNHKVDS